MIYDATPGTNDKLLRASWAAGARLYRAMGRVDRFHGASSWSDAFAFVASLSSGREIAEIQYWGHGRWGRAMIGDDVLSARSFDRDHVHRPGLDRVRERLLPRGESLIWFRTCETFGADSGQRFASRLTDELGARAAGHTYVIGPFQSGLHGLRPGALPRWSAEEGLCAGTAGDPAQALMSTASAPNTIHFMNNAFPEAWFDR